MKKGLSIKNMSVKAKIIMFSVVMLVFMVIIAGVGLFTVNSVNTKRQARYNDYAMAQYYLSESFTNFNDMKAVVRNQFIRFYAPGVEREYDEGVANYNKYKAAMEEQFALFEEKLPVYNNSELENTYKTMRETLNSWMTNCTELVDIIVEAGDDENKVNDAATRLMTEGVTLANEAKEQLSDVCALVQQESDENGTAVNNQLQLLEGILVAVAVIAFIITFGYALLLIRLITVPVAKISEAARKMALGDIDVDVQKTANDDLGQLMDDFSQMVESIKEQVDIAGSLSLGDMTVDVVPRSDKDALGKAFKKLAEDQNRILSDVKESTMQVTVGSEQVAMASQSLAQGATEQASALEEVTVSVNDIAQRTKQNAEEANKTNELVHTVKNDAIEGNNQMKELKGAMDDINKTSENISKIIKVIDDIAFQTNILALNAAVEAARAGVHGKGFSVVAEEVRNLAGKSGSAASETAEMIEDAIRKIQNGTKMAEETEKSLQSIVQQIDEIVNLIVGIAASSNEQATAVSQIDQALGQVSQVVQTNSATSEECASASEELSNQAASLRELMANFKLTAKGGSSGSGGDLGFSAGSSYNSEPVISLDGEFGKY